VDIVDGTPLLDIKPMSQNLMPEKLSGKDGFQSEQIKSTRKKQTRGLYLEFFEGITIEITDCTINLNAVSERLKKENFCVGKNYARYNLTLLSQNHSAGIRRWDNRGRGLHALILLFPVFRSFLRLKPSAGLNQR